MRRALLFALLSLVLVGGALVVSIRRHEGPDPGGDAVRDVRPSGAPGAPGAEVPPVASVEEPGPLSGNPEETWTIQGRVVRYPGEDIDAEPAPVPGAAVRIRPAPERPGEPRPDSFPPRETSTDADGRFEITGIPGEHPVEIEIDEASSALKLILCELEAVRARSRVKDLGAILLEAAPCELVIELVDEGGAPVEEGRVFLQGVVEGDAWREMADGGGGVHAAGRLPVGDQWLLVLAPGFAPYMGSVELPRAEPLEVRLEAPRSILGIVRASGGQPIESARITADGHPDLPVVEAVSDAAGRFALPGLAEDSYSLEVAADGYFQQNSVEPDRGVEAEIWLHPAASVRGKVTGEEGGILMTGASVRLSPREEGMEDVETEADREGAFSMTVLPGHYDLLADHEDHVPAREGPFEIAPGDRLEGLELRLRRGFTVRGKVVDDATGEPIPGGDISASRVADGDAVSLRRETEADASGAFELMGLDDGSYRLEASARGYLGAMLELRMERGETNEIAMRLEKGGSISGRVFDPDGRPLEEATVELDAPADAPEPVQTKVRWNRQQTETDAQGRYRLESLPAFEQYNLVAIHHDHSTFWIPRVSVPQGARLEGVELRFPRGGTIRGRILDQNGSGIAGAEISAGPDDVPGAYPDGTLNRHYYPGWPSCSSDATGGYELRHLVPGTWSLEVTTPGRASLNRSGLRTEAGAVMEGVEFVFPDGARIAGRVIDSRGGGVGDALVEVYGQNQSGSAVTEREGSFSVRGLESGRYHVSVSKENWGASSLRCSAPSEDVTIVLREPAIVAGRLEFPGRSAYPEGDVRIEHIGAYGVLALVRSDATGRFLAKVEPGNLRITVEVPGFGKSETEVTAVPGERRDVTIALRRGGSIEGLVFSGETGMPVQGAAIHVEPAGRPGHRLQSISDSAGEDGAFELESVPEGPVVLLVSLAGHRTVKVQGVVEPGKVLRVRVELESAKGLFGQVLWKGSPIHPASVKVRTREGALRAEAAAERDGRYEVPGLEAGTYDVIAESSALEEGVSIRRRLILEDLQLIEWNFELGAVVFTCRVLSGGMPAPDTQVWAPGDSRGGARTDDQGVCSLELWGSREYVLWIGKDDESLVDFDVAVPEGPAEVRRDFEIGPR